MYFLRMRLFVSTTYTGNRCQTPRPIPKALRSQNWRVSSETMYKEFYKLRLNPFEITPDPSFLFFTKRHQEALIALYYGVQQRKGIVVLTGSVGTGKTLLIRCLLRMVEDCDIARAYVFNGRLSTLEFLHYVATEFGLATSGKTKGELLLDLRSYLVARHQKNLTAMIVVDDAQDLS